MIDPNPLRQQIQDMAPALVETTGSFSTDVFPYRFWQSFRLPGWDFSVDISVDCRRVDDGIELSADIATSEGFVLAEFEQMKMRNDTPDREKGEIIDSWVANFHEFLKANASNIVARLMEEKKGGQGNAR